MPRQTKTPTAPDPALKLYTRKEVADLCGFSLQRVDALIAEKKLKVSHRDGRFIRFSADAIRGLQDALKADDGEASPAQKVG